MTNIKILRSFFTPFPFLTAAFLALSALGIAWQLLHPEFFLALRRDPAAFASGEWWRVVSPLIVNDGDPFWHWLYVSIGIVLVGTVVEQQLGRVRWLVLFLVGAIAGTLAGYLWDPYGAGASIALCGLIGGLAVWQFRRRELRLAASLYAVSLAVALTVPALASVVTADSTTSIILAAVASWLSIMALLFLRRPPRPARDAVLYALALILVCAVLLSLLRDLHGAALLAGLGAGWLISSRH